MCGLGVPVGWEGLEGLEGLRAGKRHEAIDVWPWGAKGLLKRPIRSH